MYTGSGNLCPIILQQPAALHLDISTHTSTMETLCFVITGLLFLTVICLLIGLMFLLSKHLGFHCCQCTGLNHIACADEQSGSSKHVYESHYLELDSVIATGCHPECQCPGACNCLNKVLATPDV